MPRSRSTDFHNNLAGPELEAVDCGVRAWRTSKNVPRHCSWAHAVLARSPGLTFLSAWTRFPQATPESRVDPSSSSARSAAFVRQPILVGRNFHALNNSQEEKASESTTFSRLGKMEWTEMRTFSEKATTDYGHNTDKGGTAARVSLEIRLHWISLRMV